MSSSQNSQVFIYVLKCEHDKFYIGKSTNLNQRISDHLEGDGADWTKLHKPLKIVENFLSTNKFDEDNKTLGYMDQYGIDNVRGGSYSGIILSDQQKISINRQLQTANNRCFKCNKEGHLQGDCHETIDANGNIINKTINNKCHRCGKEGHIKKDCHETTDANGNIINTPIDIHCHKCGKGGHIKKDCHETTDVNGKSIIDLPFNQSLPFNGTTSNNKCFRCNKLGHFRRDCHETTNANGNIIIDSSSSNNVICEKCGRNNHQSSQCYAKTDVNGNELWVVVNTPISSISSNDGSGFNHRPSYNRGNSYNNVCHRCGRSNHHANTCRYTTDINGSPINNSCVLL